MERNIYVKFLANKLPKGILTFIIIGSNSFLVQMGKLVRFDNLQNNLKKCSNFFLGITAENFSKKKLKVEVSNTGEKPPARFNRLYCHYCEENILPKMLSKTKFEFAKDLEELINRWDKIGVSDALMDVVGSFICLDEKVW